MLDIKHMGITTKIIFSAFIINKQVSSQSSTHSIARQLTKNAANDILPFYLTEKQQTKLAKHGCWCAKLLNPGSEEVLGGPTKVDDLDRICKEWQSACNCLHSLGGSCNMYDQLGVDQTSIFVRLADNGLASSTNCNIPANDDSCLTDICKVHDHFASKIKEFINDEGFRYTLQRADLSMCKGLKGDTSDKSLIAGSNSGFNTGSLMQCTGTAPSDLHFIELQCKCQNGDHATGSDCPQIDSEFCTSCDSGFHLKNNFCFNNQCFCSNGEITSSVDCPEHDTNFCKSCNTGYNLKNNQCELNVCVCENGEGSIGTNCPVTDGFRCSSCEQTHHLVGSVCEINQCSCQFGTGMTGCLKGSAAMCKSCVQGYYLDGIVCAVNQCQCPNGLGSTDESCPQNGDFHCTDSGSASGCDSGYYLNVYLCDLNYCSCQNGTPPTGLSCPSNNQEFCSLCDSGFDLDNSNTCALKQCTCDNGSAAVGQTCPFSGSEYCESCNTGFDLDDINVCNIKICDCDYGLGVMGVGCPSTGAEVCQSCNHGFELVDRSCVLKLCSCKNGVGVSGVSCTAIGVELCQSCTNGFDLENDSCVEKINFDCSLSGTLINPAESSRSYSTVYGSDTIGTGHARSMINSAQGWSVQQNNIGQWMTIDLGSDTPVQAMAIQARLGSNQWVRGYQMKYWRSNENEGDGVFATNENGEVDFVVPRQESGTAYNTVELGESITARYLKIIVQSWNGHISMRAGAVQCPIIG